MGAVLAFWLPQIPDSWMKLVILQQRPFIRLARVLYSRCIFCYGDCLIPLMPPAEPTRHIFISITLFGAVKAGQVSFRLLEELDVL